MTVNKYVLSDRVNKKQTKLHKAEIHDSDAVSGLRVVLGVDRSVLLLGNDDGHDSDDGDGGQDAADDDPDSGPAAAPVSAASLQSKLQFRFPLVL